MKIRKRASAILLNNKDEIYLFKFNFAMLQGNKTLWVTPGGGVNENEDYEAALRRELYEELGLTNVVIDQLIWFRNKSFVSKSGEEFISEEKYYVVKVNDVNITFKNMTDTEKNLTIEGKWWSIDELKSSNEEFFVDNLNERLQKIISGHFALDLEEI